MAELSVRRTVAVAVLASALVGGAVAGLVVAVAGTSNDGAAASSGNNSSIATAAVVRTTLSTSVQEGGSIGFGGSYTIAAPSGTSAQQLAQSQQAVSKDQQSLSADQQAESDAATADEQAIVAAQTSVAADQSTLDADQAAESNECGGTGASSAACSSDTQKVGQDQSQLSQSQQQLASAQNSATRDHDQNHAKAQADETALQGDEATLAMAQQDATNPGTTYTALPKVGDVINEDQSVYSVSNEPVPLLYGSVAAYRAFYVGMSDGGDVGELSADLIALGDGAGVAQSNHYSPATAAAVERWQRALGLPATGEILLGAVVIEPGPIRVTSVTPSVGAAVGSGGGGAAAGGGGGSGTVLSATSTTPLVTVDLGVSQEYLVKPGDTVSVVLPDGTSSVGGHIETVGSVATCPSGGGTGSGIGAQSGSSSASTSTCSSGGSGTNSGPTVPVTITLDATPQSAKLDEAPVNVNITTQTAANVLAVPVNALLALQGGGYGVQVVTGNTSHLAAVTSGIYANSMVQISGSGIRAGMRVEVPSA